MGIEKESLKANLLRSVLDITEKAVLNGTRFFLVTFFVLFLFSINNSLGQTASVVTSSASANPAVIPINGTTTITVQLRDASNVNLSVSGGTVTFITPSSGSIGSVTDNNDGTYTALYTAASSASSVTITPRLNNVSFSNTTMITVGLQYTLDGTSGNNSVRHNFSTTGNLTLNQGFFVDYLIVGGGGGGGNTVGGGGGAGGIQAGTSLVNSSSYSVAIGSGGIGGYPSGTDGQSSSALLISAGGGIAGRGDTRVGGNSGSPQSISRGSGWVASSGDGASGGGGGGSSSIGSNGGTNSVGGNGGNGTNHSITGLSVTYAGGGGGGSEYNFSGSSNSGTGGTGGGGRGGLGQSNINNRGANATGYGSGGGGGGAFSGPGGSGSNGIVILRYQGNSVGAVGGTVSTGANSATGYTLHTYTTVGNATFNLSSLNLGNRLGSVVSGTITGTGDLTFAGPGNLTITNNNTYSGQTIISSGSIEVGNGGTTGSLGSGTIEISTGTSLIFNRSDDYTIQNSFSLPASGSRSLLHNGSGALTMGGSGSISGVAANPATLTIGGSGNILLQQAIGTSGEGIALVKTGNGMLTMSSSSHNYSGTTSVDVGTLKVTGTTGTGAITVKSGATLTGSGTVKGATTVESGGTVIPGDLINTFTFDNNLTLSGGGNFNWKIASATGAAGSNWDHIQVNGTLTINATSSNKININVWSILANGTDGEVSNFKPTESAYSWTIITTTGGVSNFTADKFNIVLTPSNGTNGLTSKFNVDGFSIVQDGNSLKLQYDPPSSQLIDATDDINSNNSNLNFTTSNLSGTLTMGLGFYVDYLLIGGGGGGGSNSAGGGGAGGLRKGSTSLTRSDFTITIGAGGSGGTSGGVGSNGGSTSAFGLVAGGGFGANRTGGNSGIPQSKQGGSAWVNSSADGAGGGGGGGSNSIGNNGSRNSIGGNGGGGISSDITGSALFYAGGGGGGNEYTAGGSTNAGSGANGGGNGGRGVNNSGNVAANASNYGSGGGGGGGFNGAGGSGATGVVILRYKGNSLGSIGGSVSQGSGSALGYTIHTFTNSGSLNLSNADLASRLRATLTGNIIGSGNLIYSGPGVLSLTGTGHTYTGSTSITTGELCINSSIATSSGVTVSSGATLSGTGTLPATTVSGTHAPGTSPGVQSVTGNLTYNAGSSINWELISNAIGTRGTHYDGIDVTGNLNFAGSTTLNLIFNGAGSSVDWTNAFWSTAKAGVNGWKLFEVTGTISNLNNITVNAASQWIDINSKVLRTQRISNGTFALEQVGTAVYLTYTPLPLSALAITGINPWVQVNTSITGIQIRAVDANGTTVADFTSTATLSGTANFTGTTASFTAGVLTTSLTPATTGSALTLIVTNSTYSISGTATFDVVSSVLTGARVVDGTSGSTINSSYYSTTGGLTLSQGFFVDYLIVGGGGAGGSDNGGGGGGGGVLTNVGGTPITLSAQNYPITVGSGGTKGAENVRGGNGGNSSAFNLTAFGGGGGGAGASNQAPQTGGSGGGGAAEVSANTSGAAGTLGQGNSGGSARSSSDNDGGGGGGGAGSAGASGTDGGGVGGDGIANTINGVSLVYAGGGGGGPGNSTDKTAAGGNGGGGTGRRATADNGTANTGGGGGGAGATSTIVASGGNGGSGIVIVRYPGESVGSVGGTLTSFTGNGTIGESGVTYNVHTFNSSGNFNLSSLILNDRLSSTVTQSISGSGAFTYSGPGRLVLSANSTYTGNTTISAGTLQIGNGSTIGSLGTGSITNNGTLSFQRSNDYTIPGAISGSGTVEQFGAGTLNLGGLTTHQAGTWTLRSGSISNGTITSGNFSMIDGTASAVLAGTGTLTKTGGGTVTLSGNNTYSGTTTVSAGTLIVNGTNSGSGAVTVASGAVLKGTGTISGAITIQSGATLEPGNRLGTLNLGGGLTLNGGGNLNFLIDDASGAAGTDWNNLNVTDALTINATSGSKFNINVGSILANGSNGELANFSPTLNTYSWTILTATSITGFDATKFQINLDASNGMGGLISKYKVNGFSIVQDGNTLKLMYTPPAIQAIDGTNNGTETASYTTNTSANSLTLNQGFFVDYLIVGGGGGGGGDNGGGGGAGGVLTNMGGSKLTINGGQSYPVTVGAGGSGGAVNIKGTNGGNSSVFGYTAIGGGGGGGGNSGQGPGVGGSGGGGDGESPTNGASGNLGQGYNGGSGVGNDQAGGGGGGAGSAGTNGQGADGGDGGNGVLNTISGSANYYAGGGGAGPANSSNLTSSGGSGVGGNGGPGSGSAGSANTGSGGGGAGWNGTSANGGSGGSGVVIIRYEGASLGSVGGTVTSFTGDGTNGNNGVLYQVHTFNSSSNFNLSSVSLPSRLRATLTGNVVGTGNLIYAGPGVLSLTGTGHTYTGSTSITTGELRVNSSIVTSSGLTVSSGATLSGTGTLPATTVIGTHAPGTSPGVQSVTGNLTYNAGSSINWELISNAIGTRGTDYDGINVNGNLDFTGATTLNLIFNSTGSLVDWADNFWRFSKAGTNGWKLFEVSGSVTGLNNVTVTLSSAATDKDGDLLSAQRSGLTTSFSLVQSGTGIYINYTATPVSTTWTGTTSTDWNTGSNWSSNSTPSTDNQITIANTARSPSISGTATYRSLHVNTGATFNITSGTMSIYEDVVNNGTIAGAGTLQLNGTTAQTISGTGTIGNITINNTSGGVSIASGSNKQYITGVFTPTSGVTTTNGNLVFRSTASTEGVVGTVGTCPTEPISGDVTVEKYIPAKRAFRFLTPGVTTTSTIKDNWQEGGVVSATGYPNTYPNDATANPHPGYGTHITGVGGSANGFDPTLTNNPSLFTFNPNSNLWVAATSTNAPTNVLSQGEAYRILFRGSRAVNMNDNAAAADATTLRTTGTMNFCTVRTLTTGSTIPLNPGSAGYSFIGNPYWSVLDWDAIDKTNSNITETFYYWDPTINTRGAYVSYNTSSGSSNNTSGVNRYIQPGQAFFVQNTTGVNGTSVLPSLSIDRTNIVGSPAAKPNIFSKNNITAGGELGMDDQTRVRGAVSEKIEKIQVSLIAKSRMTSGPADAFVVAYNRTFTDVMGREDAAKFTNLDENMSAFFKGTRQSILGLNQVDDSKIKSDTIPISLWNLVDGEYIINVQPNKDVNPSREIYLLNRTTKQQIRVDNISGLDHAFLMSAGVKTKDDLALVVNSRRIITAPRLRSNQLVLYPNPVTTDRVDFAVPSIDGKTTQFNSLARMELIDNTGQIILSEPVMLDAMGRGSIDLTGVASGGYIVRIYLGRQMFTSKLLKQ